MTVSLEMRRLFSSTRRLVRTGLVAFVALSAVGVVTASVALELKPTLKQAKAVPLEITARPITSFTKTGDTSPIQGKLIWRGGLVLSAASPNFGGFSGLAIAADGQSLMTITDAGGWLTARLRYDDNGRPEALTEAMLGAIQNRDGKPIRRGRERDAEELCLARGSLDNGEVLISYENFNRIVRYAVSENGLGLPLEVIEPPPGLRRSGNDGMEAMTVLKGGTYKGRMVAFSENAGSNDRHAGWIWIGNSAKPLNVVSHGGFALTSAASLPDGTLLLLERRFTFLEGVRMRLRRIAPSAIKPGAILDGEVLIEADLSDEIDNMEGLAVHTAPNGETVLTLISDDNFNTVLQRTLLLQFTLSDRAQT